MRVACKKGVEVISNVNAQRSDVRSIAWLDVYGELSSYFRITFFSLSKLYVDDWGK